MNLQQRSKLSMIRSGWMTDRVYKQDCVLYGVCWQECWARGKNEQNDRAKNAAQPRFSNSPHIFTVQFIVLSKTGKSIAVLDKELDPTKKMPQL